MRRYALSDDQFARIEYVLPGRPGHVGRNSDKGNRRFVEVVIWKFRTGAPWRVLPEEEGLGVTGLPAYNMVHRERYLVYGSRPPPRRS